MKKKNDRQEERHRLNYYMDVYDRDTLKSLGRIVDITETGMRLFSPAPIPTGTELRCRLSLPRSEPGIRQIEFDATGVWCHADADPEFRDFYDAGCDLTHVTPEAAEQIQRLIQNYSPQNWLGTVPED